MWRCNCSSINPRWSSMVVSGINVHAYTAPWFWRTLFYPVGAPDEAGSGAPGRSAHDGLTRRPVAADQHDMNRVSRTDLSACLQRNASPVNARRLGRAAAACLASPVTRANPFALACPIFPTCLPEWQSCPCRRCASCLEWDDIQNALPKWCGWVENTPLPPGLQFV